MTTVTMSDIAADPIWGRLLPSQSVIDSVLSAKHEHWHFAVAFVIYMGVDQILKAMYPNPGPTKEDRLKHKDAFWVKPVALLHNLLMTIYSGWTCVLAFQIMGPFLAKHGLNYAPSDCDEHLLDDDRLLFLSKVFYWSKYYEFLDTWLVRAKGRDPIFLQKYHHVGAYIMMGLLVEYRVDACWLFVQLNSGIHTIMYFYYFLTVLKIQPSWKMLITICQLTQFAVGLSGTLPYFLAPCFRQSAKFYVLAANNAYVAYLSVLFTQFFLKTYKKKTSAAVADKKKK